MRGVVKTTFLALQLSGCAASTITTTSRAATQRSLQDEDCFTIDFSATQDGTALSAGAVVDSSLVFAGGVQISARRRGSSAASSDGMIFDSASPTGGDNDLVHATAGNILIISEDNDSADPDDNAAGGTMEMTFPTAADLTSLLVLDADGREQTFIELYQGENLSQRVDVPPMEDGSEELVTFTSATGITRMVVSLGGSGAVDDLQFCLPSPSSIFSPIGDEGIDNTTPPATVTCVDDETQVFFKPMSWKKKIAKEPDDESGEVAAIPASTEATSTVETPFLRLRSCRWLGKQPEDYIEFTCKGDAPVSDACPETCADPTVENENSGAKFVQHYRPRKRITLEVMMTWSPERRQRSCQRWQDTMAAPTDTDTDTDVTAEVSKTPMESWPVACQACP